MNKNIFSLLVIVFFICSMPEAIVAFLNFSDQIKRSIDRIDTRLRELQLNDLKKHIISNQIAYASVQQQFTLLNGKTFEAWTFRNFQNTQEIVFLALLAKNSLKTFVYANPKYVSHFESKEETTFTFEQIRLQIDQEGVPNFENSLDMLV